MRYVKNISNKDIAMSITYGSMKYRCIFPKGEILPMSEKTFAKVSSCSQYGRLISEVK